MTNTKDTLEKAQVWWEGRASWLRVDAARSKGDAPSTTNRWPVNTNIYMECELTNRYSEGQDYLVRLDGHIHSPDVQSIWLEPEETGSIVFSPFVLLEEDIPYYEEGDTLYTFLLRILPMIQPHEGYWFYVNRRADVNWRNIAIAGGIAAVAVVAYVRSR